MTGSHSRAPRRSKTTRLPICARRLIAGLFTALSLLSCGPQPIAAPKPVVRELVRDGEPVEGRVQRRRTHCGGMALTPEHEMALNTPAPAAGVRVYFRLRSSELGLTEALVEVEPRGRRDVSYTIQETCSFAKPCTTYSGPLPP